jgi:hypothetical protein
MSPLSQNMSEPIAFAVYTGRQQSSMLVTASCPAHRGAKLHSLSPASFTAGLLGSYRPVMDGVLRVIFTSRIVIRRNPMLTSADRYVEDDEDEDFDEEEEEDEEAEGESEEGEEGDEENAVPGKPQHPMP